MHRKIIQDHALIPQFTYLGLLAEGKTMDRKIFRENLLALITRISRIRKLPVMHKT